MSFLFSVVLVILVLTLMVSVFNSTNDKKIRADRYVDLVVSFVIFFMIVIWLLVFFKGGML